MSETPRRDEHPLMNANFRQGIEEILNLVPEGDDILSEEAIRMIDDLVDYNVGLTDTLVAKEIATQFLSRDGQPTQQDIQKLQAKIIEKLQEHL